MDATRNRNFRLLVKTALLREGGTITKLARKIGRNRSVVSTAVNAGKFPRVREAIARELKISY